MEYKFIIKKRFDNGLVDVLKTGVSKDYIGVFANVVSEDMSIDITPASVLRHTTNLGCGYHSYRVWDYSYILEIIK